MEQAEEAEWSGWEDRGHPHREVERTRETDRDGQAAQP